MNPFAAAGMLVVAMAFVPTFSADPDSPGPAGSTEHVSPRRPVATYSIVARDPQTGQLGVAVQSHWFSVGSVVPWARAGVGAVATQSLVDPAYGTLGLELMTMGRTAEQALVSVAAGDDGREVRQVAMIDAEGRVAVRTGAKCIAEAGHVVDVENQFAVQANLMAKDTVWGAMAAAYRSADGDLADRMLAALEAAQAEGGDIRGKQSAALVIVAAEATGKPWQDRIFDLRVEDDPDPLKELRRLIRIQRAYHHMNNGDLAIEHGDFERAVEEYAAAERYAPEIAEVTFWHAATLVTTGRVEASLPLFAKVFAAEPVWREVVPRLVEAGILPDEPGTVERILAQ